MRNRISLLIVVTLVVLGGCKEWIEEGHTPSRPAQPVTEGPVVQQPQRTSWEGTEVVQPPAPEAPKRSDRLYRRAQAVRDEADAMIPPKNEQIVKITNSIRYCHDEYEHCLRDAQAYKSESLLGAALGLAIFETRAVGEHLTAEQERAAEPHVRAAEEHLLVAKTEYRRLRDQVEKQIAAVDAEKAAYEAASATCEKDGGGCAAKCSKGDQIYCTRYASDLWTAAKHPQWEKASKLLEAACSSGIATACAMKPVLAQDRERYDDHTGELWSDVASSMRQIAEARNVARFGRTVLPSRMNLRAAERADVMAAAVLQQRYCPAVVAFLAERTQVEFQARAKAQCSEDPPEMAGLGGAMVKLTADCQAVFATPCSGR